MEDVIKHGDKESKEDDGSSFLLGDVNMLSNGDKDLVLQVEQNNPNLLKIELHNGFYPPHGWEVSGAKIGSNTNVKELSIRIDHGAFAQLGWCFY